MSCSAVFLFLQITPSKHVSKCVLKINFVIFSQSNLFRISALPDLLFPESSIWRVMAQGLSGFKDVSSGMYIL